MKDCEKEKELNEKGERKEEEKEALATSSEPANKCLNGKESHQEVDKEEEKGKEKDKDKDKDKGIGIGSEKSIIDHENVSVTKPSDQNKPNITKKQQNTQEVKKIEPNKPLIPPKKRMTLTQYLDETHSFFDKCLDQYSKYSHFLIDTPIHYVIFYPHLFILLASFSGY